jgi:hypothetical protein
MMVAKCVNPKQKKRPGAYPYAGTVVGSIVTSFTSGQIMYLPREVILLVVYGTIADGDDYDEIAEGARRTSIFCAACRSSTTAFPARTGCGGS